MDRSSQEPGVEPGSSSYRGAWYEALLLALSESGEGFAVSDGERLVFVNDVVCRLTGRTRDEIAAMEDVLALIAPHERDALAARFSTPPQPPGPVPRFETTILRKDGTHVPVEVTVVNVRSPSGVPWSVSIARDISARKAAEAAQRAAVVAKPLVRHILRATMDVGGIDPTQRIRLGARLAAEMAPADLSSAVCAFDEMGLGRLRVVEETKDRARVQGESLVETHPSGAATCHLALGYLRGVLARVHRARFVGAETRCASRGEPSCEFVLRARPELPSRQRTP